MSNTVSLRTTLQSCYGSRNQFHDKTVPLILERSSASTFQFFILSCVAVFEMNLKNLNIMYIKLFIFVSLYISIFCYYRFKSSMESFYIFYTSLRSVVFYIVLSKSCSDNTMFWCQASLTPVTWCKGSLINKYTH